MNKRALQCLRKFLKKAEQTDEKDRVPLCRIEMPRTALKIDTRPMENDSAEIIE